MGALSREERGGRGVYQSCAHAHWAWAGEGSGRQANVPYFEVGAYEVVLVLWKKQFPSCAHRAPQANHYTAKLL